MADFVRPPQYGKANLAADLYCSGRFPEVPLSPEHEWVWRAFYDGYSKAYREIRDVLEPLTDDL
jgi:hypothetical protein